MTVKELQDQLAYLVKTFHVPENAEILVTKKNASFDLINVIALLNNGHVTINFELTDVLPTKEML